MNKTKLEITSAGLRLSGEPFYAAIGDLHYFRIHPTDWERRLKLAKDFGLTVIQTYVPWNLHEPKRGEFDFTGIRDLDAFLTLCEQLGLYVFLRPSPYICSEWDLGGLPSWLLAEDMELRSSDPVYLKAVREYYDVLLPILKPHLSTDGGAILALAIENEYGSYGTDKAYLAALAEMYESSGMDVPYYTTDGDLRLMMAMGSHEDCWCGANFRAKSGSAEHPYNLMKEIRPDKPFFSGEWWSGRSMHWDEPFSHREPSDIAKGYAEALETGGSISFYMFAGGTNFGFMSGANYGNSFSPRPGTPSRYIAHLTSYEEDALLSEDGVPTEKYFLCRDALDAYLGKPKRAHTVPEHRTQSATVKLDKIAYLRDNLEVLTENKVESVGLKTMEQLGQDYGYICYSTTIPGYVDINPQPIKIEGVQDRALVFVDGVYRATILRDRKAPDIRLEMDGAPKQLDILVENTGRINYGHKMSSERKGIVGGVYLGWSQKLYHFTIRTHPMRDFSKISWESRTDAIPEHSQVFLAGSFAAEPGVDCFADMRGFGDGFVIINGFNIGRFRACGPQRTLYIPGGILRAENEILIFDSDHVDNRDTLDLIGESILDAPVREQ